MQQETKFVKNKEGKVIVKEKEILNRQAEYFKELQNLKQAMKQTRNERADIKKYLLQKDTVQ